MKKKVLVILSLLSLSVVSQAESLRDGNAKMAYRCRSNGTAVPGFVTPELAGKMIYMNLYKAGTDTSTRQNKYVATVRVAQSENSRPTQIARFDVVADGKGHYVSSNQFRFDPPVPRQPYEESYVDFVYNEKSNHIASVCFFPNQER